MIQDSLQVGFGQTCITPSSDCSLVGYTQRADLHGSGNDGVLDDLYARVILWRNQPAGPLLVLVSLDLCILENPAADILRADLAETLNTKMSHIIVAATHTHSGPYPWQLDWREGAREFVPDNVRSLASIAYWPQLRKAVREAALAAYEDLQPAELLTRTAPLGFAYQRRVHTPEGVRMCWNPQENPELTLEGAKDPTLTLLQVLRKDDILMLFNIGGHPVTLGKESNRISADWPGAACRLIEGAIPDAKACFFHGAGGDAHPWLATANDPNHCEEVGSAVSGLVTLLAHSGGKTDGSFTLAAQETEVPLAHRNIVLTAWRIGNTRILAVPGELFGESGRFLRERIKGPLLLITTANGWNGYLPPRSAFADPAYETDAVASFGIRSGDAEKIIDFAIELLDQLFMESAPA